MQACRGDTGEQTTMTCNCDICKESQKMRKVIEMLPEKEARWLSELYEYYIGLEDDLDWAKKKLKEKNEIKSDESN